MQTPQDTFLEWNMKIDLLSDALKAELKDLINEVLDERELEKKLNGPYDVFEDGEGEWGTY